MAKLPQISGKELVKTLKKGTLARILKNANISVEKLRELL
jgi:predicted RNA binding protein YcfA (HicA-like mRNA interferase family)